MASALHALPRVHCFPPRAQCSSHPRVHCTPYPRVHCSPPPHCSRQCSHAACTRCAAAAPLLPPWACSMCSRFACLRRARTGHVRRHLRASGALVGGVRWQFYAGVGSGSERLVMHHGCAAASQDRPSRACAKRFRRGCVWWLVGEWLVAPRLCGYRRVCVRHGVGLTCSLHLHCGVDGARS